MQGTAEPRWSPRATVALVAGLTLAALALRLPSVGNSLFGDELSSYYIVTSHSLGTVLHILHGHSVDLTPPLYYVLAWLVERLGASVTALRLIPLLAGLAAVPLTYVLGRMTVGRRAGLVAAAVMALDPFLIFYSTEARAYALVMALLLGSTVALLRAGASGDRRWWAAYAVLSCAAVYTHYTAVFLLLGQLIWALATQPQARRGLIASNVAAGILFVPWLPTFITESHSQGANVIGAIQPFNFAAVRSGLGHWAFGHPFLTLSADPGAVAIVLLVLGVVAGAAGAAGALVRGHRRTAPGGVRSAGTLPIVLALSMPVGLILWSMFRPSVWDDRDLIASWPGLALVIGALVIRAPRRLPAVAAGLVVVAFAIGGIGLLGSAHQRPDYRAAIAFVNRTGGPTDPIAQVPGPTPGPLTEVDAAVAGDGAWMASRRPILRVGQPSLAATLAAPPYANLPPPAPAALAAQAAALARPTGRLFVVSYGAAPAAAVLSAGRLDPRTAFGPVFGTGISGFLLAALFSRLPPFVQALPAGLKLVATRTFTGFLPVSVYEFSAR